MHRLIAALCACRYAVLDGKTDETCANPELVANVPDHIKKHGRMFANMHFKFTPLQVETGEPPRTRCTGGMIVDILSLASWFEIGQRCVGGLRQYKAGCCRCCCRCRCHWTAAAAATSPRTLQTFSSP